MTPVAWNHQNLHLTLDQYRLGNGLAVLLHRDETLPIAAVEIWYGAGSADDGPVRTGLAHLVEHLMFEGSAGYDGNYFQPLVEAGGLVNGSTSPDRTNYYEVLPSHYLELGLWLEADRMAHLAPALSPAKFENQRSVVQNERRQRYDNQPYGRLHEEILRAFHPPGDPYSWPVIGSMEHLDVLTLDDAREYLARCYRPGNAALAVVGNFDADVVRAWIERYFGPVPPAPVAARNGAAKQEEAVAESLTFERRLVLEDRVALPCLEIVWPAVPRFHADEPALDFAGEILAGRSKASRLIRRLVYDEKRVTSIGAYHHSLKRGGKFGVRAFGLPGRSLEGVESAIREEVDRLVREPPTPEEIQRTVRNFLNRTFSRLETVGGKADALLHHWFYAHRVEPDSLAREIERYRQVQGADVERVVTHYLRAPRVVVEVVPQRHSPLPSITSGGSDAAAPPKRSEPPAGSLPLPGKSASFRPPAVERMAIDLSSESGAVLPVLFVRWPKVPRVVFQLVVDGGAVHDPGHQSGLARLTADVLSEATATRDAMALARVLDRLGADLEVSSGLECSIVHLRALREGLPEALAVMAEVVREPRLAADDFVRERDRLRSMLAHRATRPASLADDAIDEAIFGADHPYGRPADGDLAGVAAIERDDLVSFHAHWYRPGQATLIAVGDAAPAEVAEWVQQSWSGWGSAEPSPYREPVPPPCPRGLGVRLISRTGSAQSVVRVGQRCPARGTPDFFPLLVLHTALGGMFTSRLNLSLREERGYTYGVRSSLNLFRHAGSFVVGTDVQGGATRAVVTEILDQMGRVGGEAPITPQELHTAKAYLCRRFPASFETAGAISSLLANLVVYHLPLDYYDRYQSCIEEVSLDQVHEVARRYLSPQGAQVVVVGNPEDAVGLESCGSGVAPP